MAKISHLIIASLAYVWCSNAHGQQDNLVLDLRLSFDKSMELFNSSAEQRFGVPTIIVFDSSRQCIAMASNRDVASIDFLSEIAIGNNVCDEISLDKIVEATDLEPDSSRNLTFLVLTDTGGVCKTCPSILAEFQRKILSALDTDYEVLTIDIGMTDWFSRARQ